MSRKMGNEGEEEAVRFLQAQGFEVLARNYTIRGAELDIVAREGDVIAFIEVKRSDAMRGSLPRERVTVAKQRRICKAALHWLQQAGAGDAPVRFDVVEITPQGPALLRGAFDYVE